MVPYLSQVHRIFDCDGFTREFLEGLGISVPQPEPLPEDGFSKTREKVKFQNNKLTIICASRLPYQFVTE